MSVRVREREREQESRSLEGSHSRIPQLFPLQDLDKEPTCSNPRAPVTESPIPDPKPNAASYLPV